MGEKGAGLKEISGRKRENGEGALVGEKERDEEGDEWPQKEKIRGE